MEKDRMVSREGFSFSEGGLFGGCVVRIEWR